MELGWIIVVTSALALSLYLNTLSADFAYDDRWVEIFVYFIFIFVYLLMPLGCQFESNNNITLYSAVASV